METCPEHDHDDGESGCAFGRTRRGGIGNHAKRAVRHDDPRRPATSASGNRIVPTATTAKTLALRVCVMASVCALSMLGFAARCALLPRLEQAAVWTRAVRERGEYSPPPTNVAPSAAAFRSVIHETESDREPSDSAYVAMKSSTRKGIRPTISGAILRYMPASVARCSANGGRSDPKLGRMQSRMWSRMPCHVAAPSAVQTDNGSSNVIDELTSTMCGHPTPASIASRPHDGSPCADGRSARQQQASLGRATQTLRQSSPSRNGTVMVRTRVDGMLGAPRSWSVHARRGAGGAWRLQAPTRAGVAAVSVGVGSSVAPADVLRRALRARVRPVAPRGRAGGRQVPRVWRVGARVRAHPLRRVHARVAARVLVQVPLLLSERPRQAPRDLDAVAGHDAVRAGAAAAGGAHHPQVAPRLLSVPPPRTRRDRPRRCPHRDRLHSCASSPSSSRRR